MHTSLRTVKMLFFILIVVTVSFTNGFLFSKKAYPDWDVLSVTVLKYSKLPMIEDKVISEGWTMTKDACKVPSFFVGRRYVLKNDNTTMLLFDVNGRIAGIQMALPKTEISATHNYINKGAMSDGQNYVLTAYFTDPKTICGGARKIAKGNVGDKLFFLIGITTVMEIPLKETDLVGSKWGNGRCFVGMGQHYWYNTSEDMDCDDFFPFFILYNGGNLNAFGFASSGNVNSPRAEHPQKGQFGYFFKNPPKCFNDQPHLSTQHVFLQRRPYFNFC